MKELLLILFGVVIGILIFFIKGLYNHLKAERVDIRNPDYLKDSTFSKLKDTIRHIVVEYNIRRNNHDFLLNIDFNKTTLFQITHRSHYPELLREENDLSFGLALYLPIEKLSSIQKNKIYEIMKEESDMFLYEEVPFNYYVADFGKRIKYCSYFLVRLLKEVFLIEHSEDISFKLFSEGKLPYSKKSRAV